MLKNINRRKLSLVFLLIAFSILCYFASSLLLTSALFIAKVSITKNNFIAAVVITLVVSFLAGRSLKLKLHEIFIAQGISVLLFVWALFYIGSFYDCSFDGPFYHMDAVMNLANGWNPYTAYILPEQTSYSEIFLNHYPQGGWITEAVIYKFTNHIEQGKAVNLLFLIAVFFASFSVLLRYTKINFIACLLAALSVATNPLALHQIYSYYIDSQVYSAFVLLLIASILLIKNQRWTYSLFFFFSLIYVANVKFTGLIYAGIWVFIVMIFIAFKYGIKKTKFIFLLSSFGFAIAAGVLGYPTYVKNTIHYGHPFYPLMGDEEFRKTTSDIITPANFRDQNRFHNWYYTTFGEPGGTRFPESVHQKKLFKKLEDDKLWAFRNGFSEISGFGAYYAEVFIFVIVLLIVLMITEQRNTKKTLLLLIGAIIATAILNPQFWYVRYAPQMWLFPLFIIIYGLASKKMFVRAVAFACIVMMLLNSRVGFIEYNAYQKGLTQRMKDEFEMLRQRPLPPIIKMGWRKSGWVMISESGINYKNFELADSTKKYVSFVGTEPSQAIFFYGN